MATSTDGGLTWSPAQVPNDSVIAGQPVVQPSGRVVVPIDDGFEGSLLSYVSTNGGQSYVGPVEHHFDPKPRRGRQPSERPLPSAEVDADGKVYVVWADCRFRSGCPANDIVMSTSMDGQHWSSVVRIPIDPTSSTVDHFLPGIAVDRTTSGATTHIGVTYYYYPESNCSTSTCRLTVGFIKSMDGGASWTQPVQVVGPFKVTWLPLTSQGYMVGDYISTSFVGNKAYPIVAAARQGTCTLGQVTSCLVPGVHGDSRRRPLDLRARHPPHGRRARGGALRPFAGRAEERPIGTRGTRRPRKLQGMAKAVWSGSLSFGLVNIPVRLYNATSPKDVRFHQFQRGTGKRVRYRRVTEGMHDEPRWPEPQDEAAPWTGPEDAAPRIGRPDEEPSLPPGMPGPGHRRRRPGRPRWHTRTS